MTKLEKAVVEYLETFGQPQTLQAILDFLAGENFKDYSWADVEALVADKQIKHADGGVDERGEKVTLYAPLSFKG